ncbi:MAG TPA: GAF domain-containing protein, partial [Alteromonas australica]|nr:GAF domain-containing protein [Alteromonas australica]
PLIVNDELIGVLDIDSPKFGRFDADDEAGLKQIADILIESQRTL